MVLIRWRLTRFAIVSLVDDSFVICCQRRRGTSFAIVPEGAGENRATLFGALL